MQEGGHKGQAEKERAGNWQSHGSWRERNKKCRGERLKEVAG